MCFCDFMKCEGGSGLQSVVTHLYISTLKCLSLWRSNRPPALLRVPSKHHVLPLQTGFHDMEMTTYVSLSKDWEVDVFDPVSWPSETAERENCEKYFTFRFLFLFTSEHKPEFWSLTQCSKNMNINQTNRTSVCVQAARVLVYSIYLQAQFPHY